MRRRKVDCTPAAGKTLLRAQKMEARAGVPMSSDGHKTAARRAAKRVMAAAAGGTEQDEFSLNVNENDRRGVKVD